MKKPYRIELELPGLPKTINSMGRAHWSVKAREAKEWRSAVVWAVGTKRPKAPLKHAVVTYVRVSSSPLDFDNLAGSFKHVQDGLVDAGVIENDKLVNIGHPEYRWEKGRAGEGRIRIIVVEQEASPEPKIRTESKEESQGSLWDNPLIPFGREGFKTRKSKAPRKA